MAIGSTVRQPYLKICHPGITKRDQMAECLGREECRFASTQHQSQNSPLRTRIPKLRTQVGTEVPDGANGSLKQCDTHISHKPPRFKMNKQQLSTDKGVFSHTWVNKHG